jgi:Cys-tRNA(Pro) deacylase
LWRAWFKIQPGRCVLSGQKFPMTPAIRILKDGQVDFTPHQYRYEEKGGTTVASKALGADEHVIIKTLVFVKERHEPLIVLMHGDKQVSTKTLARILKAKNVEPADPKAAEKYTGYQVGGISPFGIRCAVAVYAEESILSLDRIYINGGKRGFLVEMPVQELIRIIKPVPVAVAI